MKPERILLPINVAQCPLKAFGLADYIARSSRVTVILLHVVELNLLASENRVYEELSGAAAGYLARLARAHLDPRISTVIHVRTGSTADQILAEARAAKVDLIILPATQPSFWRRVLAPILAPTIEQIIRKAPCTVLVAKVKTFFNCQKAWGHELRNTQAALDDLRSSSEATSPEVPAKAA